MIFLETTRENDALSDFLSQIGNLHSNKNQSLQSWF